MGQSLLTSSGASDCPYNVGDIYITTLNTNPQDIWQNTTWGKVKDRFLLSSGDTYSLGAIGGEAAHTLTVGELARHGHDLVVNYNSEFSLVANGDESAPAVTGQSIGAINKTQTNGFAVYANISGSGQPHNNMPPYLCVNMWIRKE